MQQLPKRNKRRTLKETIFAVKLRNSLKKESIETLQIVLQEVKNELQRRSRKNA